MTQRSSRLAGWLVRCVSPLVPHNRRDDWRREWAAELEQATRRRIPVLGVLRHAVTLRLHDLDSVRQDVGYAVRGVVTRPGFSLAVVLTLALGIGANAGVFSLINTVLLRPLPVSNSDRLFLIFEEDSAGIRQLASYPTFVDWHDQADVFDGLTFVRGNALSLRHGDETSFVLASFVTDEFFDVFDTRPEIGRLLDAGDFQEGAPPAVVISHRVWTNVLGANTNVLGTTVRVDEVPATVVGVLPASFILPRWTPAAGNDIWMPLHTLPSADRAALMQRDFHADSRVVGLLKESVAIEAAQSVMNGIAGRLAVVYPATSRRWTRVGFVNQQAMLVGSVRPRLIVLAAAVVVVLLISCVNLASLFLSRGTTRRRELAVRSAIGADRSRIFRQLVTECLLLSSLGAVLGTVIALVGVNLLRVRLPAALPRLNELAVDWRVLVVSLGLTIVTAMLFALVSVRQVRWSNLIDPLRQSGPSPASGRGGGRVRDWLVSAQVALSMVLLVGAGLLVQSLMRLSAVEPGFQPSGLAKVQIYQRLPQYQESVAALDLYRRVAQSVESVPGVRAVGLVNHPPFGGGSITSRASLRGDPRAEVDETIVFLRTVSAGYFEVMGIPVIDGREFSERDVTGPDGPLIVNETLAAAWGGESPVGQRFAVLKAARDRPDFGQPLFGTVVGVVGDIKHFALDGQPTPTVYLPFSHNVWSQIFIIARTDVEPAQLLEDIEAAVRSVEPGIPLEGLGLGASTVVSGLSAGLAPRRLNAAMVGAFAVVALLLAVIGVYGVSSFAVASEAKEIGIRLALGARPGRVSRLVVARTLKLVLVGLITGIGVSLLLTRFMTSVLFNVTPTDPGTYVLVSLILLMVGVCAGYLPARRAAAIDPVSTLKS